MSERASSTDAAWNRTARPTTSEAPLEGSDNRPVRSSDTRPSVDAPANAPAGAASPVLPVPAPPAAPSPALEPLRLASPAPADAAATRAPAVTTATRIDPRDPVRSTIERYRTAYQQLDAAAARAVWPGVDAGALARAFGSLTSQELWFESCTIDVAGARADATCRGHARVVPKFGGGSETTRRTWQFALRQTGNAWVIDKASVR